MKSQEEDAQNQYKMLLPFMCEQISNIRKLLLYFAKADEKTNASKHTINTKYRIL